MCWLRFSIASAVPTFLSLIALLPAPAAPDSFPRRPVKVIVPFSPGGGSDTFARIVQRTIRAERLLDRPFVIVNIPGAGGTIGSRAARKARPDGHTLLFLHDGILTAKYAGKVAFGMEAFEPVAITGRIGLAVVVAEESPYRDLPDLLDSASRRPDTVTFAANIGAPSHFMALVLEQAHGTATFRFVQSGGGAKRFAELKGGHVEVSAFSVAEYLSFRDGGLRALAYLGETRHDALPEVPTARDHGIDATYANLQGWWAPAGTPRSVVETIAGTLGAAMDSPELRARLKQLEIDPVFLTGDEAKALWKERDRQLARISPETSFDHLPRLSLIFLLLALAGAVGMSRAGASREPLPLPQVQAAAPRPVLWLRGGVVVLAASGYVAILSLGPVPFPLATTAFIVFLFALDTTRRPTRRLAGGLAAGVALSLVCYGFFVRLLGIDLP